LPAAPPLVQLETTEVFEGSTIRVGELATFPGAVTVAEGSPSVTWTSDRLGVLGTTPALAWTPTALDVGRHLLELTATSGGLTTSMAFEVFVENLNAPPVIAAIHVNPGPYLPGVQAVLSSDVTDADGDALTYAWSASDVPYPYEWRALGSDTTVTTTDLTALTYTWVRLVVTDSVGNQTEYIEPLAAINPGSPSIGSAVVTYEGIDEFGLTILRVEATALDPEEGAVADRRFRWYFDAPAFRGRTYSGNNGRFYIVLTTPFCEDIPVVTVTARDSAGNTAARRAIVEGCDV
jgi:hypothetical protein